MKSARFTFKGDGKMSEDDSVRWNTGYAEGLKYTLRHYRVGKGIKLPYDFRSAKYMGPYWRGWNEGAISGRSQITNRDYPDMSLLSLCSETGVLGNGALCWYDIKFKDGRETKVLCYGRGWITDAWNWFRWTFRRKKILTTHNKAMENLRRRIEEIDKRFR